MRGDATASGAERSGCAAALSRRSFLRGAGAVTLLAVVPGGHAAALPYRGAVAPVDGEAPLRYPVPPDDGAQIDRDHAVILVRWEGRVFAFALSCPHQNTALRWSEKDQEFQCPKHRSRYGPDGSYESGRATRSMDRFAVSRSAGEIVVDVDRIFRADEEPDGWEGAVVVL